MKPQCSNCKYWDREKDSGNYRAMPNSGMCTKAQPFWDVSEWKPIGTKQRYSPYLKKMVADEFIRTLKDEHKDELFFVQDGSDYQAWMITMHNFFCACFKEKDDEAQVRIQG